MKKRGEMSLPLDGIRVIDFGRYIAGPYCAMLLADLGADVIRVERREGGEDRYLGPVTPTGEGGLFLNVNRNKRGITLNPAHPASREILSRLVRTADLVIVNMPLEVMQRLRLDYESLRAIKQNIILVMASAFGPKGPYSSRVGFDGVAQAMSGAMSVTGFPGPPVRSAVSYVDFGTALHAAFGAMAALYQRQVSGEGRLVDVSLLATGVMFMNALLAERSITGIQREQRGNAAFYAAPSDSYRTQDGWILVPTIGPHMFNRWAVLVGREDLIADPRCADDITRANNYSLISDAMSAWCSRFTRDEAISQLEKARIPCGPVYSLDEVLSDPQVAEMSLLERVEYPGAEAPIPLSATPLRLSNANQQIRRRAPALGEHTDEVLRELDFTAEQIAEFRRSEAI
ncbi:MAG TPA: CoA transferase [Blastocatellia bacterium]|nr:CoA transferase [Blastocatellia bacterium]